ncbi:patatin-like phospholipase family protein [Legionella fallonii]|uniref:Lysophospholipase substrate of the Dot/Icm secretion system n=1 Tax=Legionella fallonii LLAP-10 TaxID=1212491 RepID=A0A098G2B2_9GAMM|nr:patatin-like phospholipase family protein [Legionella fallonii]CEG56617.1 lysophospholipase substrate of the Dot/Icm secretion system [Legionella fallonii LLAP-10]
MPRELKRKSYEIVKNKDDQYELLGCPVKGFVASGGGAKGIYYAALVQEMEKRGILKDLSHVSGASAGAMTVSLLAVGMNATDFTNLVSNLDITKLLDNQGTFRLRARGDRFRNIMEVIYALQIKEHLKGVEPPAKDPEREQYFVLKQKIQIVDTILKKAGVKINSVDDIIKLSGNATALDKLDKAFAKSPKIWKLKRTGEEVNPRITFNDLENLRAVLPEEKKHLIKNLSVVTTNQFTKRKQVHNVNNGGGDSISQIVRQSAAHPLLFTPTLNAEGHSVADGGILDNMPSDILLEQGLNHEQILCAKIEADSSFKVRLQKAKQHAPITRSAFDRVVDGVARIALGGSLIKGRAEVLNREKVYYHLDNMIYLNSGTITATTTSLTQEQRKSAIEDGSRQCKEFFESRIKVFDNPLIPMLYLGKDKLDETLISDKEDSKELFHAASYAQMIFFLQAEIANNALNGKFQDLPANIAQIHDVLVKDAKLDEAQTEHAMALILKQINYQCEGKLEAHLLEEIQIEQDAQKVGWFTQLLNYLYTPIEAIINFFCCCSAPDKEKPTPEQEEVQQEVNAATPEEIYTARRIHSMFSAQTRATTPVKPTELTSDEGLTQNDEENPRLDTAPKMM